MLHKDVYKVYYISHRDVDQVHDIMDGIAEQQEKANEMSEIISTPVGFGHDYDEVSNLLELRNFKIYSSDEFCCM